MRERLRHVLHGRLRHPVKQVPRLDDAADHRADVHDRGVAGGPQCRERALDEEEDAADVDRDVTVEVLERVRLERTSLDGRGVVDEHVEPAERLERPIDDPARRLWIGEVVGQDVRPPAGGRDRRGRLLEQFAAPPDEGDGQPLLREQPRGRRADARPRSSDHRDPLPARAHRSLPSLVVLRRRLARGS